MKYDFGLLILKYIETRTATSLILLARLPMHNNGEAPGFRYSSFLRTFSTVALLFKAIQKY